MVSFRKHLEPRHDCTAGVNVTTPENPGANSPPVVPGGRRGQGGTLSMTGAVKKTRADIKDPADVASPTLDSTRGFGRGVR